MKAIGAYLSALWEWRPTPKWAVGFAVAEERARIFHRLIDFQDLSVRGCGARAEVLLLRPGRCDLSCCRDHARFINRVAEAAGVGTLMTQPISKRASIGCQFRQPRTTNLPEDLYDILAAFMTGSEHEKRAWPPRRRV